MLIRAVVVDNKDPLHRGRLKVRAYGWHDELPEEDLPWAEPCLPFGGDKDYGMLFIPEIGSTVWITFEVDDTFKPNPMCPVWVGVWWGQSEVPSESQDGSYKVHTIKTKKGHKVIISDESDAITIQTVQGDVIKIDGANRKIGVSTDTIELTGSNSALLDTNTYSQRFTSGDTQMTNWNISGDVVINGNLLVSGNIQSIGQTTAQGGLKTSPSGQTVFVDDLVSKYNSHTHTDSVGGQTSTPDQTLP